MRCFCTAVLRKDGTCRYGCNPELRSPALRRRMENAKLKRRELEGRRIGISVHEARAGLVKVSNAYAAQYVDNHDRAKRAWNSRRNG